MNNPLSRGVRGTANDKLMDLVLSRADQSSSLLENILLPTLPQNCAIFGPQKKIIASVFAVRCKKYRCKEKISEMYGQRLEALKGRQRHISRPIQKRKKEIPAFLSFPKIQFSKAFEK